MRQGYHAFFDHFLLCFVARRMTRHTADAMKQLLAIIRINFAFGQTRCWTIFHRAQIGGNVSGDGRAFFWSNGAQNLRHGRTGMNGRRIRDKTFDEI